MLAANNELLNLRRAFVNLEDLGVAHQLLDGILAAEPVATVNLDGIGCVLIRCVTSKELNIKSKFLAREKLSKIPIYITSASYVYNPIKRREGM